MEDVTEYLDFQALPESVANQISSIIKPCYDFFFNEMPFKLLEINKISSENIRLTALVDLSNEAMQLFKEYEVTYKTFIAELKKCHLSSKYFPTYGYGIEGNQLARSISDNRNDIPYSIEYMEFFNSELDFKLKLEDVIKATRELRIKLEIAEKYNVKRLVEKNPKEVMPLDINMEFLKLFENRNTGLNFITLLKSHEFISDDEKWKGISNRPGELRDAHNALKDLHLLKSVKHSLDSLKIFYKRFGLITHEYGRQAYISERALRNHGTTKDYDNFVEILKALVLPQK